MKILSNLFFTDIDFCKAKVIQGLELNYNLYLLILLRDALRKKCPYSEFSWFVFSPDAEIYRPEKLCIWTIFTQWCISIYDILILYKYITKRNH